MHTLEYEVFKHLFICFIQGHNSEINCICWDGSGEYLASVSQDTVKVLSIASGTCIHELRSHGNQYQSCIFHPRYPKVLIVGGYQVNAALCSILLFLFQMLSCAQGSFKIGILLWLNLEGW
jgi:WD40 repeat protein